MQNRGVISCFRKIVDQDSFTPPTAQQSRIPKKTNYSSVKMYNLFLFHAENIMKHVQLPSNFQPYFVTNARLR